jgi:hypothetical protein
MATEVPAKCETVPYHRMGGLAEELNALESARLSLVIWDEE